MRPRILNNGEITGGSTGYAIFNYSDHSIGTIENTGTIAGGPTGSAIVNAGDIGTINNTGTIKANSSAAISNSGTINTIINSGDTTASNDSAITNSTGASIGTINNTKTITTTAGGNAGLKNRGTINTIINSGEITSTAATSVGIDNSGTIDKISNSGKINGKQYGIYHAGGTIGTISNSGTITGQSAAIKHTTSTSFVLENSGVIAGNIESDASNLTISGSNDENNYGVLTGYSSDSESPKIGTITHRNGDVTFSTGYLKLNDHINVTVDHAVVNKGATLKLVNPINITGDYTQTGGGLVVQAASASSFGSLAVSGDAAISNTTLVMSGNDLEVGETYTIVGAGGTGTYAITQASVVGTSGLGATTETVGKDLVVTITENATNYKEIGASSGCVAESFGATLDKINDSSSTQAAAFQNKVLAAINSLPSNQQGAAIKKLAPANAANNVQVLNQASTIIQEAVQNRQQLAMSGGGNATTGIAAGGGY